MCAEVIISQVVVDPPIFVPVQSAETFADAGEAFGLSSVANPQPDRYL